MKKCFVGIAKLGIGFAILLTLISFLIYIVPVFAADFNSTVSPSTAVVATTQLLNFSINNTDSNYNITKVNITLPSNFAYIDVSNGTTASNTNFSNTTNSLIWTNTTPYGFVENGSTEYFWFKVKVPTTGSYNFSVMTLDTNGSTNSTNVLIIITGVTSTTEEFSVTPSGVYFNWTNSSLDLIANVDNITLYIDNKTTEIYSSYSQNELYLSGSYPNLNDTTYDLCFATVGPDRMKFKVQNQTGNYTNTTGILNATNSTLFYLKPHLLCPPGKYSGYFLVKKNESENVTINATIDIPISPENTFNISTNTAFFKGKISQNSYHSYYFWTNQTENITGVTIKLTWTNYTKDLDIFLFDDQSQLLAKSINKESSEEIAYVSLPSTGKIWEIRIYGNVTSSESYSGNLHFTSLNITNIYQNETISSLDFGTLDPNETSSLDFILKNEDDQIISNVNESTEVYWVGKWENYNKSKDFTNFLVPKFAQKIKVKINWDVEAGKNLTDWDLYLTDVNGNSIGNSTDKYLNANVTNATLEEYIVFEGSFNLTSEGYWNISVINQTNGSLSYYNVTAHIWFNESAWINTTYNQGFDFNSTGENNSSYNVAVNITVPERNILDGSYEGFLEYYNSSGWKLRLPLSFKVKAGMLIINNSLNVASSTLTDNIGFNKTLEMNVSFNNTGSYPIYYSNLTSNNTLYHTGNSSYIINFTVDGWPINPIQNDTSGTINITIKINTSLTKNQVGIYRGWIFFNTTNSTVNSSSYPYETFNLTLDVNLTDKLTVNVTKIEPAVVNVSAANNITITTQVKLANGSIISNSPTMGLSNFTRVWINETNVTSYGSELTNITKIDSLCVDGKCYINATLAANLVGGGYKLSVSVKWYTGEVNLTGVGINTSLVINDTGLNLTAVTSKNLGSVNEGGGITYFNASVTNYGPITATGKLTMSTCDYATIVSESLQSGCGSTTTGNYFNININGNGGTCWYRWKIITKNVTADSTCLFNITASDANFGSITGISLTVKNVVPTEDGIITPPGCTSDANCTATYFCNLTTNTCQAVVCPDGYISNHTCIPYTYKLDITHYDSIIYAVQGTSNSTDVTVKNSGNLSSLVKLNVSLNVSGVNTSTTPTSYNLSNGSSYTFTVNFSVANTTQIGNHSGSFKAFDSNNTSTYDTKSFTLTVLPREEEKLQINVSYENYTGIVENITQEFEAIKAKGFVSEINLTKTERVVNRTNIILNRIKAAIEERNYIEASALLSDLEDAIAEARNQIAELKVEQQGGIQAYWNAVGLWVVIGIIIAGAIGVVIYMLLPVEGYPRYKLTIRERLPEKIEEIFEKIKEIVRRKKIVREYGPKRYVKGYKRHVSVYKYKRKERLMERIKRLFKRK